MMANRLTKRQHIHWIACLWIVAALLPFNNAWANDEYFEAKVAPLLVQKCIECHNSREPSGELDLTSLTGLKKGGQSGAAVESNSLDNSFLWERVVAGEMPPDQKGQPQPLHAKELKVLKTWIQSGARWPKKRKLDLYEKTNSVRGGRDWWSLQKVTRSDLPEVQNKTWARNSIDTFVLSRLEAKTLQPAPRASRRTLIRRLYNDLLGLPPSHKEIDAFVNSTDPNAYEQLVDRLLASPHFGERWGRYWLDLVRYAETSGYERDQVKPKAWKYRDWVINAFNNDMPYDQFVLHQLAGDEIPDRDEQSVIATGLLRLGTWNDEPNEPHAYKYERLEDMVHVTSSAFLGMTVKCARCHDHKFDPIPQIDYYSMAAAFWAGYIDPRSSKLVGGPSAEELGYDVLGWTDRSPTPPALKLLKNGDHKRPQNEVKPANLSMVSFLDTTIQPPAADAKTSQRRLQLARWIIDPQNPLAARIFVNRLWQHHFGAALVRSPNNFGFTGELPTHPKLLDWLASELIAGNWKPKRLHKLMLMSQTYQQSSIHPEQSAYNEHDFGNRLWWRANRRRLDAEGLRDAILVASGQLDLTQGGPSIKPSISSEALEGLSKKDQAWTPSPVEKQNRRSVYIFAQRSLSVPMMTTFDACDTTLPCGKRDVTTVPTQALALLNNEFVHQQSAALALRILKNDDAQNDRHNIKQAWQLALGRTPTNDEIALGLAHLREQRNNLKRLQTENQNRQQELAQAKPNPQVDTETGIILHLRADEDVVIDGQGRVSAWYDQSPQQHHATQVSPAAQPTWTENGINGQPTVHFSGAKQFMTLAGQVFKTNKWTIFAVVNDQGHKGHRAIISNWNGAVGNAGTSLFLGTTAANGVRLSDDFVLGDALQRPNEHFVLTAVAANNNTQLFQDGILIGQKRRKLSKRNLTTEYVIGQQGNINGEFWHGDIAEILVYNRALNDTERQYVWHELWTRYQIEPTQLPAKKEPSPQVLALASLCHVLLNTNEFMYVD